MKIVIVTIFISILIFSALNIERVKDFIEGEHIIKVESIRYPKNVLISDDGIYIQKEDKVYRWDLNRKSVTTEFEFGSNISLAIKEGKLIACTWINREISDSDQFATTVSMYNEFEKSLDLNIKKTVMVIKCDDERLIVKNSLPILQELYYEFNIEKNELMEIGTEYQIETNQTANKDGISFEIKDGEILVKYPRKYLLRNYLTIR